jgi:P4 family phage/plasmid primase-like protien
MTLEELKAQKRWIVHLEKAPYYPGRGKISVKDTQFHMTYDEAVKLRQQDQRLGIGIVLGDGLAGIDVDGAVEPDGTLPQWLEELLQDLNTYAEFSPSGTGVHILALSAPFTAVKASGRTAKRGIEAYAEDRFFTFTGHILHNAPVNAAPLQALAKELKQEHLAYCAAARGHLNQALTHGDLSHWNNDESAADMALIAHIARYGINTPQRVERWLWLYCAYWRQKHQRRDYIERTLGKAMEGSAKTFELEQLIQAVQNDLAHSYCHLPGEGWLRWNGRIWERVANIQHAIESAAEAHAHLAPSYKNPIDAVRMRASNLTKRFTDLFRTTAEPCSDNELVTPSGVLNLDTGNLHPHSPHRLARLITAVPVAPPDPESAAIWEEFLKESVPDPDTRAFLQRAAGYTLYGGNPRKRVFVLWGPGNTGKSTFVNTLERALGSYAATLSAQTLFASTSNAVSPHLLSLRDRRMIVAAEAGWREGHDAIKLLSGNDTLAARNPYEKEVAQFSIQGKIWITTNYPPPLGPTDSAAWSRVHVIPFVREDGRAIEAAAARIRDPRVQQAALWWAYQGYRDWRDSDLRPPREVTELTAELRRQRSVIYDFVKDRLELTDDTSGVPHTELWRMYTLWFRDMDIGYDARLRNPQELRLHLEMVFEVKYDGNLAVNVRERARPVIFPRTDDNKKNDDDKGEKK